MWEQCAEYQMKKSTTHDKFLTDALFIFSFVKFIGSPNSELLAASQN